jgi:hypothetical protein
MAIFRCVQKALSFAYLIEAYEVSAESIMAKALRRHMMELGIWNEGPPSTVDFNGLNGLEVRAQCAMIRAAVRDRLPAPERCAVEAIYGINEIVAEEGKRRAVFRAYRYRAILSLGEYLAPSFAPMSPMLVDLLVARAVDRRVVCRMTLRELAERFDCPRSTLHDASRAIARRIDALEALAVGRLEPGFVAGGVTEPR